MIKLIFAKLILILLLFSFQISHAETGTSETVVNNLHETLIKVMKESKTLDYDGRYKILKPVVMKSFDFETIARITMGRYWKKLDNEQKAKFINIFSKLSIATYTAQFNNFSGEAFEYLENVDMKKGRTMVKAKLVTIDRVVSFNYILHPTEEGWRIINVIADGVSDLSLKRSDYATIMKTKGFDILVRKLLEKIKLSSNKP